jgi:magnesium-transporting ATPase (P-type)
LLPDSDIVRVYVKGAPELIIGKCTKTFDVNGQRINFTDEEQNYIYTSVIYENFTSKGYRTLAFAYKDMTLDEFNDQRANSNNFENDSDRESLE